MAIISELVKGQQAYTVSEEQIVLDVVRAMVERNIGAVPVLRGSELVGLFSERDLMKRVVAERRDPAATRVAEVMSTHLHTVHPNESMENCMVLMREHSIRHLPICDGKKLVGMVSIRDILIHDLLEKDGEVNFMRAYIRTST